MIGRPVGRAGRRSLLVLAIGCVVLVGGGPASVRASAAEPEGWHVLAQRLCKLVWWDDREKAALERLVRDRSNRHVADIERQATAGLAVAQCALGMLYKNGWGVQQDNAQAATWYRKAAEQGDANAQFNLGVLYANGLGVPQDSGQAAVWYRKAAEQGDANAQFNLGVLYANGLGVPQDSGQAAAWYRKAAEQGVAEAQNNLGVLYGNGQGVPQDDAQAAAWFRKAAEQGYAEAQYNLGVLYAKGRGVPQDDAQAAAWFRKAAEQGYAKAQYNLGRLYENGQGVPQDFGQAAVWYRKAAERGVAEAQNNLGVLYEKGRGVPQDFGQAAAWYRKAAEQGHAKAQFNLGALYEKGKGVPQDFGQAAAWYRKAAEQGVTEAQTALGMLYSFGWGVPQDFVLAYLWASLAASQKSELAGLRDSIARMMTPQQIAEAQRLAREWKPKTSAPSDRPEGSDERPVASRGTGFVVSRQGHVLTAHHVVAGCRTIQASVEGRTLPLTVVATDPTNDAAVLKLSQPLPHTARFRAGPSIRPGEGVVVIGFPLAGLLAAQPQVTTGVVSALAGIGNDTRLLQITAPVQPGNSGGPLLDQSGAVVGMVVSKLDAIQLAKLTGDLPQNVNFALTGAVLKAFLDAAPVAYEEAASSRRMETVDLADQARRFTLAVECR